MPTIFVESVLERSPTVSVLDRRNRAMIAFTGLTGVRDGALVSLKLKHVDLLRQHVNQDPRADTKNSKHIRTTFFPVGGSAAEIVEAWVSELRERHLWERTIRFFQQPRSNRVRIISFGQAALPESNWTTADAVRKNFKQAFEAVGLQGFNPHSCRHALAMLGEQRCKTPEDFKAWSQNLGRRLLLPSS
jgi:integrase